jgi:hypothetical protein
MLLARSIFIEEPAGDLFQAVEDLKIAKSPLPVSINSTL